MVRSQSPVPECSGCATWPWEVPVSLWGWLSLSPKGQEEGKDQKTQALEPPGLVALLPAGRRHGTFSLVQELRTPRLPASVQGRSCGLSLINLFYAKAGGAGQRSPRGLCLCRALGGPGIPHPAPEGTESGPWPSGLVPGQREVNERPEVAEPQGTASGPQGGTGLAWPGRGHWGPRGSRRTPAPRSGSHHGPWCCWDKQDGAPGRWRLPRDHGGICDGRVSLLQVRLALCRWGPC